MTTSLSLASRRKRIKFRAWHRGMREMDLILGRYIDSHIDTMTSGELDEFEQILAYEDRDLLQFIMEKADLPDAAKLPLLQEITRYTQQKPAYFT